MRSISFSKDYNFESSSIKFVGGMTGIYFIYLTKVRVSYPFGESGLIYIGLSESRQNSIGRRLAAHLSGQSGNIGIRNYASKHQTKFTYHSFQLLRNLGANDLYEIESFFLSSFLLYRGAFPICNNQSGTGFAVPSFAYEDVLVDWNYFS